MKKLVINKKKLRPLTPTKNAFHSLARAIIYQQLSGKAAATIERNFLALFPRKNAFTPQALLTLSDAKLRSAGLSGQKSGYLRDLAAKFLDGTIVPKKFPTMTDEEIIEHLVAVKGIGTWTAHMFLIFALNRPNVLPVGDLGVQKGFKEAFKLKVLPTEAVMRRLAKAHDGEHTALALHLWDIADKAAGR